MNIVRMQARLLFLASWGIEQKSRDPRLWGK